MAGPARNLTGPGRAPAAEGTRGGEPRFSLLVRPSDLDALRHVNNAAVLEYLEAARQDWLARQGIACGTRIIAVVSRAEVSYLAEIPGGQVEVATSMEFPAARDLAGGMLTYRAILRQRVYRPGIAAPAVDALITVAFLDAAERHPVPLQDFLGAAAGD